MITKDQALSCDIFHYTGKHQCTRHIGPRGGITEHITAVQRSGMTKTWRRSPERFKVPVKYGLYDSGYITEKNAVDWHVVSECPLVNVDKGDV